MKIIVIYPDRFAKHSLGDFGRNLLDYSKTKENIEHDFTFMPIVNGGTLSEMESVVNLLSPAFHPIISESKGLTQVLLDGYRKLVSLHADHGAMHDTSMIVRMDTNEHPIDLITTLVELSGGNLVIYGRKLDKENASAEEIHANNFLWPKIYEAFTNERLRLSNTHGFQAFNMDTLENILPVAEKIISETEEMIGEKLSWGMDAIMALAAVSQRLYSGQFIYHTKEVRNRPKEKIEEQFINHVNLLITARKILFAN
ncbi:MAG: hypothetical protein KBF62_03145 [Candidatus Pacebacteria bacterium]|nr:hypothetical protein [Candidatus Paceibacterota bacterium]MBP9058607.1 hypothetical protein [Candidatus Paceibacterota bacterium]MBP9770031.1 hypothetical protein [Candidatus Paceibacterota bacterium]